MFLLSHAEIPLLTTEILLLLSSHVYLFILDIFELRVLFIVYIENVAYFPQYMFLIKL